MADVRINIGEAADGIKGKRSL